MVVLAAIVASACGRQERSVVDEFFTQSRLRDKTALQKIATVTFEPRTQGIVEQFDITTDQNLNRLDILFGAAAIQERMACRVVA